MQTVTGIVETIVFQSGDGFVVFKIRPAREASLATVVGKGFAPLVGEEVELDGEWVEHSRFGSQFKALVCRRKAPSSVKGIERFLASGIIKGVGPAIAARIVARFGARALEILEFYPHRLTEVEGIGARKAETIRASFAQQSELRDIMLFLETHGVSGSYAGRIVKSLGAAALSALKSNPYILAEEVEGIGFRTADQIAMALG